MISGMVFIIKAGMLSGEFYFQAALLLLASVVMALWPDWAHLVFGIAAAIAFFVPGFRYERRRRLSQPAE